MESGKDNMEKLKLITHKGKQIVFADYSRYRHKEERSDIIATVDELKAYVATQPEQSVLVLSDVTNIYLEKELSDIFTEMAEHNKPYIKRSAVIGVTGFKKSIHNIMMALTGREVKIFNDSEAAKDWLAEG